MRSGRFAVFLFLLVTTTSFAQNTKENADFKLAVNLFNDKLYDLSLEQFKQFISTYPSSPQSVDAKFYIALADRSLKKNDDARAAFQNFALTYPEHTKAPDAWWNIGEMFSEDGKLADAASSFERIKVFQPKSPLAPKALLTAAEYFERAGDSDNAKKCLRSLIADYPSDENVTGAHARLGSLYIKENNLLAARRELLLVTEGGGDKDLAAGATIQLARIAEASGNPEDAERLYHSIIDEKKSKVAIRILASAKLQLARLYISSGRQTEAGEYLQKLAADSSKLPQDLIQQSLVTLGECYSSIREFKKAADAYERSLNHRADSSLVVTALFGAGQCYDALKDYRRSFAAFSSAAETPLSPKEKRYALLRAATLAVSLKSFDLAAQYYGTCLDLFPNDAEAPDILFRIAELNRNTLKEYPKAIELYGAFLAKYPQNEKSDDAVFDLAQTYESLHETDEAVKTYERLVKTYPSSLFAPTAMERAAFLRSYQSPDKEQTVKQLALLIGDLILEKEKSELALRLGDIYLDVLEDFPQAAKQYQKGQTLSKDSSVQEQASFKRTVALTRQSQLDTAYVQPAIAALTAFVREHPSGNFSDEAAFSRFVLQSKGAAAASRIATARSFLEERPNSRYTSRVLLALGNAQKEKGLLDGSIDTYVKIANGFPTLPEADEATAQLGIQLVHLGRNDTASIVLSEYLRSYPRGFFSAEVLYEKGMLAVREEQPLVAATSFEQLRTKYFYSPRTVDCLEPLAQCYHQTRQYDRAVALYRQQIERLTSPLQNASKDRLRLVFQLARTYDSANDTAQARATYLSFVNEDDQSEDASEAFARIAAFERSNGRVEVSMRFLEKSVAANRGPSNTADLSAFYFGANDYAKAIEEYTALIGLEGVDSAAVRSARIRIISAYYRADKTKEAEQRTTEFLKLYGSDKNALAQFEFEKAMALYRGEEFDRALSILRAFPAKYDSSEILPQADFWIGKILETKELPDSAMVQYDYVMRTFPRSDILPKVYLALGNIYFLKEKYDEAVKYYRLIVDRPDRSPDLLPFAMSNLIEAYKEVALFDGALELTRNFIERYPNDESILDKKIDLGVLYQKLGYYDQAIMQLQGLLETTNKDLESEIRYYLGESYYYKGDYQQAILEFLKVPYLITKKTKIDWTPNSYYMSAQSYEKMGKFDQALNMYQQIIDRPGIDPAFKTAAQKEVNRVKSLVRKDVN